MSLQQNVLLLVVSVIISSIILLKSAREYRKAQTVVKAVITTYSERLAHYQETYRAMSTEVARLRGTCERLEARNSDHLELPKQTVVASSELTQALRETCVNIKTLNDSLQVHQVTRDWAAPEATRMSRLEGVIKRIGHETTPTEIHALKILATEGAKTSKELHGRVGRSREHFARLMKKLYERGYVDRDTSKTPFVYAINDGIAERVLEVTEQVAGESIGQSSDAPLFPLKHEDDHMEAH